jgi:hypothetical protein
MSLSETTLHPLAPRIARTSAGVRENPLQPIDYRIEDAVLIGRRTLQAETADSLGANAFQESVHEFGFADARIADHERKLAAALPDPLPQRFQSSKLLAPPYQASH